LLFPTLAKLSRIAVISRSVGVLSLRLWDKRSDSIREVPR
jgi:hypothetical protein